MKITFIIGDAPQRIDFFGKSVSAEPPQWSLSPRRGRVLIAGAFGEKALPDIAAYAALFDGNYFNARSDERTDRQNIDEFFSSIDDCLAENKPLSLAVNDPLGFLVEEDETAATGGGPNRPKSRLNQWRNKWRQIVAAAPAGWTLQIGINSLAEMALLPEGETSYRELVGDDAAMAKNAPTVPAAAAAEFSPEVSFIFLESQNDPLRRLLATSAGVDLLKLGNQSVACRFPGAVWIETDQAQWFKK